MNPVLYSTTKPYETCTFVYELSLAPALRVFRHAPGVVSNLNPKPLTLILKPQTLNPKPRTQNPKP